MAKWRALHGSISTSEQVIELTEFEQLLFTWMIPHADDWGIITGNPKGIKVKVIPGTERSLEEIDDALTHIEQAGLIWRYEADGHGQLVEFREWDDYQPIRKDRRGDGRHPNHAGQMPTNDGQETTNGCQMDAYTRLDKTRQDKTRPENNGKPFSAIFTEITGVLVATGVQAEEMDAFMEEIPEKWFREACKAAVDNNARKWSYVRAICRTCRDEKRAPGNGKGGGGSKQLTPQQQAFKEAAELQAKRRADAQADAG